MTTPYLQQETWARVLFGVSVAAFAVGEFSQAVKSRRGASRVDVQGEVVIAGPAVFVAGAVVGWLGLALRWWSFLTLGSYFTTVVRTAADQVVVSRGPYRFLRHPSYTGLLAALLGCGLMLGNWVGVICSFLLVLAALVYRLLREERALTAALGEAYADFSRNRARLVPFVW